MCSPLPSSFSLDDATQSLTAGRAAKPPRGDQIRAWEMLFAPGTITAPKKSGFRGRALALARPDIRRAPQVRRRLRAAPNLFHLLAFSASGPILAVLGLAFLSTVDGLPIPLAGSSSPPASGFGLVIGAAVSSLGTSGMKRFLATLEQAQPLPRLTCPLTGSRLAASLMWAQGSCELPTAKPRMRRLKAPLRGALLAYTHTRPPFQTTIAQAGFQATRLDTSQLQTTDNNLVPYRLLEWYPRELLLTGAGDLDRLHVCDSVARR
jgi:hypothetical protein